MLLAFKPLLHNPFLWKERKINSIIAMIVLLVIASLVVRYLPLYHTTLPHPEWNTPCWVNLLLPYIRLSTVLPFYRAYLAPEFSTFLYILLPSWQQSEWDIVTFQLRTGSFKRISFFFRPILFPFFSDIYSFITDYQVFNLRYKDNTARDKNETKVGKQSANQFQEALHGDLTKRFLSCWRSASLECNEALH